MSNYSRRQEQVPKELQRSLPRFFQELADPRAMSWTVVAVLVALTYVFARFPNGWVRFIPPVLGPFVGASFATARPLNPYNNLFASSEGITQKTYNLEHVATHCGCLPDGRRSRLALC